MKLPTNWPTLYFNAFPSVVYVRGTNDAAAYDFNRGDLIPIPSVLVDLVEALDKDSCKDVLKNMAGDDPTLIEPYLRYLVKRDFGAFREDRVAFRPLSTEWHHPGTLLSAQVELSSHSHYQPATVLSQIIAKDCHQLELRLFDEWTSFKQVNALLENLRGTTLRVVDVYLSDAAAWTEEQINELFERHKKLLHFKGYGATQELQQSYRPGHASLLTEPLTPDILTKNHYQSRYVVNYQFFSESLRNHPVLNRRVSVDSHGQWKNDLLYDQGFGHVNIRSLDDVLADQSFTQLWHVSVDRIVDIKDSALRYAIWPTEPLEPAQGQPGLYQFASTSSTSVNTLHHASTN